MIQRGLHACVTLLCVAVLSNGCTANRIQRMESPDRPPTLEASYTAAQKSADVAVYNTRVQANDLAGARVMRDLIVQNVRREIEVVYQAFERGLFANKAAFEVEMDIFELLLSTATTLSGSHRAQTNLAALLTGTKGTRLSVDKNVFGEKTYSTLVSQMRASRSKASASMVEKLAKLDVNNYPLAEAETDLVQLFNAGTIHDALVRLSAHAGATAEVEGKKEADAVKEAVRIRLSPATSQEVDRIKAIRDRFNELFKKKDLATARGILKALDRAAEDDLPEEQVWQRLNSEIQKAAVDKSYLATLARAFGIAQ